MAPPHRSLSARLVRAWGASCDHLQPECYDRVLSLSRNQRCLLRPGPDHDPWTRCGCGRRTKRRWPPLTKVAD
eukprot:scaffold19334_cov61-Phaeocystis_antarctica.AAC.2